MSKRPVPNRKISKSRSSVRYKAFAKSAQRRLENEIVIVSCPQCNAPTLNHYVCQNCGTYRGKPVIAKEKKIEKITKIKA